MTKKARHEKTHERNWQGIYKTLPLIWNTEFRILHHLKLPNLNCGRVTLVTKMLSITVQKNETYISKSFDVSSRLRMEGVPYLTNAARIPQEGCMITVIGTLPEFRKMTARVMYKLRVALQMSCTRSVGSKSFEAIWRDEDCLRRASQRCFTATWKHCRNA